MLTFRTQDLGHCKEKSVGSAQRTVREEDEMAHLPNPKPNEERKDSAEKESVKSRVVERRLSELSFRSDEAPARSKTEQESDQ